MKRWIQQLKFRTPHTYALLMGIITIACLLTYIIPAGEYDREEKMVRHSLFRGLIKR